MRRLARPFRSRALAGAAGVAALAALALVADRALVRQERIARESAEREVEADARRAALAVRATLARIEEAAAAGRAVPRGVDAWRVTTPPDRARTSWSRVSLESAGWAEALASRESTSSGLPLAVVAAVALGAPERQHAVRDALLDGELPVSADDLPTLAARLGAGDDPRVGTLRARLEAVETKGRLPEYPNQLRNIDTTGAVEAWSRRGAQVVRYRAPAGVLLAGAALEGQARLAAGGSGAGLAVPDVPQLAVVVEPDARETRKARTTRIALWLALAACVAALVALVRAFSRESRALERERVFLAAITHELRTPVAGLRALGETLADGRGDAREYGALIARESRRLETLAERALTAARLDALPSFAACDVGALVRSTVDLASHAAERAGKTVVARVTGELGDAAWDEDAVRRALGNLVDNALRHGGSAVLVTAREDDDDRAVRLEVHDDGPGIRRREARTIFQPFRRGVTSTGDGSGLGLHLVESVARAHGGHVLLESDEGSGCTFALVLPRRPAGATA